MAKIDYSIYPDLLIERKANGVCLITLNRPDTFNSANMAMHWQMANVWRDIDRDPAVKLAVITGAGKAFCAGGDFEMVKQMIENPEIRNTCFKDTRDLVHNMVNCDKPIIAAVNGVAVGAGMATAMMSDITVASTLAKFNDGHIRLGVAAGDHAAAILPLLCGMSKTKYYTLTGAFITAAEAEKINLVTEVVAPEKVLPRALEIANVIANGPQTAIRHTKRALNQWLRQSLVVSFDYSCAVEMLGFTEADAKEGLASLKEKRNPKFPSSIPSKL